MRKSDQSVSTTPSARLDIQRVAVGTRNPVKIAAAEQVVRHYWPRAQVKAVDVASGVSDQPWGLLETVAGARERARAARRQLDADLGIGLEGGVEMIPEAGGLFLSGWAAVATRSGSVYVGSGGRVVLPPPLVEALRRGEELGPAMDRLSGEVNSKHTIGSVGLLTLGFVTREAQFAVALAYALVPLLRSEWW